jgi:DNA topoisomerase-3
MLSGEGLGKGHDEATLARYAPFAQQILARNWVVPNKRIFNNAKVSDHFAIIPTLQAPKHLSEPEFKLYDMVVKRFLAVFYPAAEYLITTRITRVEASRSRPRARSWSTRAGSRSMAAKHRKGRKATSSPSPRTKR